jgi:membrane fusion protein, multidrug efflux system
MVRRLLASGIRPIAGNYYGCAMSFLRFSASTNSSVSWPLARFGWVGLGAVVLFAGCSKPAPVQEPVRSVKVVTVSVSKMESGAEFSGEVRARVESRFGFRVAGKLVQRAVEPGQRVKSGQLLAQMDARDYLLAAEAAKAQVTAAATNRNLSVAEYKRFSELKDQNFISGAELDRRDAAVKSAEAQLEQAQAQLSSQRNQTGYTKLTSDVNGVVVGVEAEAGQVVAAGQAIVRIAKDGPRDVVFSVPEDRVALVTMGSKVDVRPWSGTSSLKGVVREVAASADPATRTFQIKVAMDGKDAADTLPLGSTVNVVPQALSLAGIEIIKLPTSALKRDGKATSVWVVDSATMTVKSQVVEIVSAEGNEVVIASGVTPGMMVVAAGVHVLQAGQKVTLYRDKGAIGGEARPAVEAKPVAVKPTTPAPAASK